MKRSTTKKGVERRKHPRNANAKKKSARPTAAADPDGCHQCGKKLSGEADRALFVEEEVGRIFCSESCIASYFTPEIERLEKDYARRLTASDLSGDERESLAHLRWITLQEPDEVWREKTLSGDYRYTLISEFKPADKKIWSICITLFLRGEPSFLYLALTTRNAAMVNYYRKGEQVEWIRDANASSQAMQHGQAPQEKTDYLADAWTEDETFIAKLSQERRADDIPLQEFGLYHGCLDETLEAPDEVWSIETAGSGTNPVKLYHFIRHYPEADGGIWYVIIARELEDGEQIEIIDSFPTRDSNLVEQYRQGEQEVGEEGAAKPTARVVH